MAIYSTDNLSELLFVCDRCGFEILVDANYYQRADRNPNTELCKDCRAKPTTRVRHGDDFCYPHQGRFDDDDNPLTADGEPFRPGARTCGHRDCVRPSHVIEAGVQEPTPNPSPERKQAAGSINAA